RRRRAVRPDRRLWRVLRVRRRGLLRRRRAQPAGQRRAGHAERPPPAVRSELARRRRVVPRLDATTGADPLVATTLSVRYATCLQGKGGSHGTGTAVDADAGCRVRPVRSARADGARDLPAGRLRWWNRTL